MSDDSTGLSAQTSRQKKSPLMIGQVPLRPGSGTPPGDVCGRPQAAPRLNGHEMLLFSGQAAPALELFFVPSPARPLLPSLPSVTLLRQPLPVGITFTYGYWSKVSRTTHDAVIPLSPRLLYVGSRAVPPKPISDGTLTVRQTLTARDTARNPPVDDNSTSAMATPELRQRQTASPSNEGTTPNGVLRKDKGAEQRLKHGILMQLFRTLLLSTWFNCCCVCIVVTDRKSVV